jgi:hypothetical protein
MNIKTILIIVYAKKMYTFKIWYFIFTEKHHGDHATVYDI